MKFRFDDQPHRRPPSLRWSTCLRVPWCHRATRLLGQALGADGHAGFTLERDVLTDNLRTIAAREAVRRQADLSCWRRQISRVPIVSSRTSPSRWRRVPARPTCISRRRCVWRSCTGCGNLLILVHSIAIRAGVVKTFEQTEEHFRLKYPRRPVQVGCARGELGTERLHRAVGRRCSSWSRACRLSISRTRTPSMPALSSRSCGVMRSAVCSRSRRLAVLIDEPQNMATPLRHKAVATLNPLVALRYSATTRSRSTSCTGLARSRRQRLAWSSGYRSRALSQARTASPTSASTSSAASASV